MEKFNEIICTKKILISPLDWGLGHTTRCIPLISMLIKMGCEVIVAADENQEILIRSEFRDIAILRIDGYGISYSRIKTFFLWKIVMQLPKIYRAAGKEKRWVEKMVDLHQIDAVISDNRFGFLSKKVPSVFITHQLSVQTGFKIINTIVRRIYYSYINRFSECWVPDVHHEQKNLAGILSHPTNRPKIPLKYIGMLSRFQKCTTESNSNLLIVISGPEPQRTIFEKIILKQLPQTDRTIVLVRGLPNENSELNSGSPNVTIYNHLPAKKLNNLMQSASLVIARAGYSTVMDLVAINKNAVLIPTPGQTEQEYLAKHLIEQRYFFSVNQSEFILNEVISEAEKFKFSKLPEYVFDSGVIEAWIKALS